jgi:hypothetical protein
VAERLLHDDEAAWLGPVAIAQFLDLGWLLDCPLSWSRDGLRALRNGRADRDALPVEAPRTGAAYWWPGRRASRPRTLP